MAVAFIMAIIFTYMLRGKYCGRGTNGGALLMDVLVFLIVLGLLGNLLY
jgi:hypothetical protein